MLQNLLCESKYNINHDYLQVYFDFLSNCQVNELTDKYEKHHILPRALFPMLTKNRNNIIKLKPRDHFLAHYHLAKLIKEKETLFAFNQMKRVLVKYKAILQDVDSLSMLYEEFRLDLSNLISSQNTGWFDKKTEEEKNEFREKMSKQSKGRLPIKYPDGTTTVISTTHPDYISGLAVHVHSGTTRSEKAKENFKRANSAEVKGFPYHDPQTKQVKYYKRGEAPESWIRGAPVAENSGKPGAKWYYDPITNKQGRFHENEIPEGWVKGRINFGNAKPFGSNTKPVHV